MSFRGNALSLPSKKKKDIHPAPSLSNKIQSSPNATTTEPERIELSKPYFIIIYKLFLSRDFYILSSTELQIKLHCTIAAQSHSFIHHHWTTRPISLSKFYNCQEFIVIHFLVFPNLDLTSNEKERAKPAQVISGKKIITFTLENRTRFWKVYCNEASSALKQFIRNYPGQSHLEID